MSERTLEELRKEINGKQIVWVDADEKDLKMDAILLCPPNGEKVSIKFIGYSPEEISDKFIHVQGYEHTTIEYASRPEYCIGTVRVVEEASAPLEVLADLPIGAELIFGKLHEGFYGNNASCPYG